SIQLKLATVAAGDRQQERKLDGRSRLREMERTIVARWQEWSGKGIEHLVLHEGPDRIVAEAVISATVEAYHFGVSYRIECDAGWRVKTTHARVIGDDAAIDLTSDGAGR